MSFAPASRQQIGAIHAEKARIGLDDDTYRDLLFRETRQRSSKQLSAGQAGLFIDHLKGLPSRINHGANPTLKRGSLPLAKGAVRLTGPYAAKLRALWISGYNLAVVQDRTDKALLAFLERQTGLSHTAWLTDPKAAAAAIEGLKAWIGREAGVDWPKRGDLHSLQDATHQALRRRLIAADVATQMPADTARFGTAEFTEWMRLGGERLRKALQKSQVVAAGGGFG